MEQIFFQTQQFRICFDQALVQSVAQLSSCDCQAPYSVFDIYRSTWFGFRFITKRTHLLQHLYDWHLLFADFFVPLRNFIPLRVISEDTKNPEKSSADIFLFKCMSIQGFC